MKRTMILAVVLVSLSGCAMMDGFFDGITQRPHPELPDTPVVDAPVVGVDRDAAYGLGGAIGALLSAFLVRKYGVSLIPGVSKNE